MPPPTFLTWFLRPARQVTTGILLLASSAIAELTEITDRGTASQTSEWNGGLFPASEAIDGDAATFSHTDANSSNNAWELELDAEYEIRSVELAMRIDCCVGRLTGTTLRWFDAAGDSVFEETVTDPGVGQTTTINLPPGTMAKSLRVGFENGATNPNANTSLIHFSEV
ncbi:MAG: hypothetical protein ACI9NC_005247, partial [Verrucomicrobiales bacterium]